MTQDLPDPQRHLIRGEMLYKCHELSRLLVVTYDRMAAAHGLTYEQWWTLMHVRQNNGAHQAQIARLAGVSRAAIGQQIKRLEKLGFLTRETDPADKRMTRLYVTDLWMKVHEPLEAQTHSYFDRILADISPSEEKELLSLLGKIAHRLTLEADAPVGA